MGYMSKSSLLSLFALPLLHKIDPHQPAWCSPRSWLMASQLHSAGLDLAPAIGMAANSEFQAFIDLYRQLPDLVRILGGFGEDILFPIEPSTRYATAIGLTMRADDAQKAYHAFRWMSRMAPVEWVQLFVSDLLGLMRSRGQIGMLVTLIQKDSEIQRFMGDYRELVSA